MLLDHRQQPVGQPRLRPPLDRAGDALPSRLDAIETFLQRFDVSVAHRFELGHFDVEVAAEGSVLGGLVVDLRREVVEVEVEVDVVVVAVVDGRCTKVDKVDGGGGWCTKVDGGASPSGALSSSLARPRAAAPRPPSRRRRRPPPPSPQPCPGTRPLEHPSLHHHPRAAAERPWLGDALPPRPEDAGGGGMRG